MSSELEDPVSDDATRFGVAGAAGEVESTVTVIDETADVAPLIVWVDDTIHAPSISPPKVHPPEEDVATNVQVFVTPSRTAVTTTVAPICNPPIEISGDVSLVRLSVDDIPRSELLTRSGVAVLGAPTVVALVAPIDVTVPVLFAPVTASRMYCPIRSIPGVNVVEFAPVMTAHPAGTDSAPETFMSLLNCCAQDNH
jgi:hypothetical protein